MMKNEPIGVCILFFNRKNELLMGKRKNAYKAGFYGLPGGRIAGNESLETCAKRELLEETGVQAIACDYVGIVREWQGIKNFIHVVFLCKKYKGTITNSEPDKCEGWEWYDAKQLPEEVLPGHKSAIEMFLNSQKNLIEIT